MLQQHIYIYINTHTTHTYKIYVFECCSLLKSYTLFVEFLLTTLYAIFKAVLVSFNFIFFLNFFI